MKTKLYTIILLLLALCLPTGAYGQNQYVNYVRTKTMTAANGSAFLDQIDYIGSDGKKYHTVYKGITPSGKNLLTFRVYDPKGLEVKSYLPNEMADDISNSYLFGAHGSNYHGGDTRHFHQTVYESSAVGRVTAEYGPGQDWANNPIRYDYGTNTVNGVLSLIRYTVGSNYTLTANGTVPAGTLNVTKVTDEDGHEAYSFTDQLGRTLLERRLNGSEQLDTYYVYDSYGRLCYVLQPMYQSEANLSKYAYRYEYDSRGRCTKKTLPGTEYVLYEYNEDDLLVFSQDGNQRTSNKWTYYLYDSAKRLIEQGVCTGKNTSSNAVQHIRHYYDTYSFIGGTGFTNSNYTTDSSINGRGRKTGSIISVLETTEKVYVAYYYNSKGELIKQVESNNMSGHDVHAYTYTFTGQPASMTHTHTASGKPTITEVLTYTYDHGERLTKVTHKLNNAETVTLAEHTYDKFGRVATKKVNGGNNTTYSYNIRSWLIGVINSEFTQQLTYNNGTTGYNGNVTKMTWGNSTNVLNYSFTYDGVNRMLNAEYSEGGYMNQNLNRYTEKVTEYDKNGNIKKLQRYGQTGANSYGLVDNLTYTYNGNKVTRVDDAVTATSYTGGTNFVNGANADNEYTYDANGNMNKDSNKGILNIQYNSLNLPSQMSYGSNGNIVYHYRADGLLYRLMHVGSNALPSKYICGNVIYENGTAQRLLTDEGYVDLTTTTPSYYYYLKDHQGNNRVVINSSGTVQETNHYYPFGGLFATNGSVQDYKYNGKRLDSYLGLDWYDYGARHYDAALGRWHVVDPMAEKYYSWNAYNYCGDNPINRIDLFGMDWYQNNSTKYYEWFDGNDEREGYKYIGGKGSVLREFEPIIDNLLTNVYKVGSMYQNGFSFDIAPNGKGALLPSIERGLDFFDEFLFGVGPEISILLGDHPYTKEMMSADKVLEWQYKIAINDTNKQGQATDIIGNWGLWDVFTTPSLAKQFVGSYRYDAFTSSDGKYLNNVVSDSKSRSSLFYHLYPSSWNQQRSQQRIMGNTYQFYIWQSKK